MAVEPPSVIWDRPIWKAQALDRSPPLKGETSLNLGKPKNGGHVSDRGLATSRPWLLQEAGGVLNQNITSPLESRELLPVLPS